MITERFLKEGQQLVNTNKNHKPQKKRTEKSIRGNYSVKKRMYDDKNTGSPGYGFGSLAGNPGDKVRAAFLLVQRL